jgi:competence protein ComEC
MSFRVRGEHPGHFTPAAGSDLADSPPATSRAVRVAERSRLALARPLVPLAMAFCLGIALGPILPFGSAWWAGGAFLLLLLGGGASFLGWSRLTWPLLLAGFLCLGVHGMVVADREAPPHHLSRLPEQALIAPVLIEGWVTTPPDPRPPEIRDAGEAARTRFVVEVTALHLGKQRVPATGQARLTALAPLPELHYGDEIRSRFRLRHPRRFDNPGSFDYPGFLAAQGIFLEGWTRESVEVVQAARGSAILAWVFRLRALILQRLDAAMAPAEAGLLKATVLGDRSGLTPEMNQAFLDSGTYHILAISGLNVSILAGALFGLFRLLRASPRFAAGASAVLVTWYAALAGAGASVIRAAVMADVFLLAVVLDRRGDLLNSLALSALALLWWNPRFLHDVGFQLTYLATLGIILILPRCEQGLTPLPRPLRWALESVAITLAATVMTLPILAVNFNRVSPVGLLANIPIVPLSGLITGLGTAACALVLLTPTGLPWLNQVNGWLVDLLFAMARWFAAFPWSSLKVYTPTAGMVLTYYAAVACGLAWYPAAPAGGGPVRFRRWAGCAAGGCCLILVGLILSRLSPSEGEPRVRLTLLDVGQGEAIYVEYPGSRRMLVDAGGMSGEGFDVGLRVITPYLWHEWVGNLDVLVLTHPESDHVGGAATILKTFPVGEVWTGGSIAGSATDLWIQEYLRQRRIPHRIVAAGSSPGRWGGATVEVLHPDRSGVGGATRSEGQPPRPNNRSIVLRIRLGNQAMLLTGDIEKEAEGMLVASGEDLRAQILKVPHHGSRRSSTEAFLDAVRPAAALVSVGYRNPFRHPNPEVLARYKALGIRVWRTDQNGAITVEMRPDGTRVWGRRGESPSSDRSPDEAEATRNLANSGQ